VRAAPDVEVVGEVVAGDVAVAGEVVVVVAVAGDFADAGEVFAAAAGDVFGAAGEVCA
jgi:hypothetical protein